ncbi:MAG: protoporphyrinogen oxidase [Desulfobulbaceae bacterium S5133MH15]|nr:MAG: protoporphyrinogen oxidase [Desulfobulbaceae bacterium S5133MH15]
MSYQLDTIIIGGGLSGLTTAHTLHHHSPDHRFLLLEKEARTGGAIQSNHDRGFITEIGPHGFLDNCMESNRILTETGLDREVIKAPLVDFVRYVYLGGKLNLIPQTPTKILMAPLIPLRAKFRVLADLVKPPLAGEPTVAKWINYRFGPALLPFVDAIFTGTYAGDYNKLTIDSVMPGVRSLEKEYGSIIRGLLKKRKREGEKKQSKPKFTLPAMTSFATGMQRLPEKLTEQLSPGENLLLNAEVTTITKEVNGWEITSSKGHFSATNLVIALPVNPALQLLKQIEPTLPQKSIPQTQIATVAFGFNQGEKLPPGFGYLIPECENRFTLGSLFSSNMFSGRAPENHIVFETLIGGRRHPEKLELDDATLTRKAFEDVREVLDLPNEPVYTTVLRSTGSIPQLEQGYPRLLKWRNELMLSRRGLHICGFGWEGIGLNDMMKNSTRIAESILSSSGASKSDPEVKSVYF